MLLLLLPVLTACCLVGLCSQDIRGAFSHDKVEEATGGGASVSLTTRRVVVSAAERIAAGARRAIERSGRGSSRRDGGGGNKPRRRLVADPRREAGARAEQVAGVPSGARRVRHDDGDAVVRRVPGASARPLRSASRNNVRQGRASNRATGRAQAPRARRPAAKPRRFGLVRGSLLVRESKGLRWCDASAAENRAELPPTWQSGWRVVRAPDKRGPPDSCVVRRRCVAVHMLL